VITRRLFPFAAGGILQSTFALAVKPDGPAPDPWPKSDLMEPAALAAILNKSGAKPNIICVAFPVLYRQRHIIHAEFAGPTSKPEGIDSLKAAVAKLPKDSKLVVYCGCCPMARCPNVRPAYKQLKEMGYSNVRVLNIPTNFHDDWVAKDYPTEESIGVPLS
jgi:rhodanese-related sulfurtransferase